MKWRLSLLLIVLAACSASQSSTGSGGRVTGEVISVKMLRSFHDASSISLDQFLNLYVVESSTNTVIKLSPNGDSLRSVSGFGADHNQFNGPIDLDARLTNAILIADNFNHRIEQYTKDLTYVSTLFNRQASDPMQRFGYPRAVAADDAGNIYVADGENKRVIKARSDFTIERTIGGYGEATRPEAILTNPIDLAVDKDEHLIVLDNGGTSLVEFDNLGNLLARTAIGATSAAITTSNDTVFALLSSDKTIRLYRSVGLIEVAQWRIESNALLDSSPLSGVAVRSGAVYVSTRQGAYACKFAPIALDTLTRY